MTAEQAEAHDELRKTIAKQDALIKQLGEALGKAHHAIHYQREVNNLEYASILNATNAYNNYLRERGE